MFEDLKIGPCTDRLLTLHTPKGYAKHRKLYKEAFISATLENKDVPGGFTGQELLDMMERSAKMTLEIMDKAKEAVDAKLTEAAEPEVQEPAEQ